jgi:hypothetical protein
MRLAFLPFRSFILYNAVMPAWKSDTLFASPLPYVCKVVYKISIWRYLPGMANQLPLFFILALPVYYNSGLNIEGIP